MKRQKWLWGIVEPAWERTFGALTRSRGYETRVGPFRFRLDYLVGARLDKPGVRAYEPAFFVPFVEAVSPGDTVFDVGSHVGIFALGAAATAGPRGRVLAFEPAAETLDVLRRHVRLNGFEDRVEVVAGVASDVTGEISFYVHGSSMANSMSPKNADDLNPEVHDRPATRITVPSHRLDDVCLERGISPRVMKIDVEGAELAVLRGARDILARGECAVFLEVHPEQMKNCESSEEELTGFLGDLGYRLEPLDERNPLGIYHSKLVRA